MKSATWHGSGLLLATGNRCDDLGTICERQPGQQAGSKLCYSVSVFTHLPENVQDAWLKELHRVIEPGGLLMVTLAGEGDLGRTTRAEQERFRAGKLVVIDGSLAGTNLCGAYHPEAYVRRVWSRYFEVRAFIPEGAKGCPNQDLYVLERVA